MTIPNSHIFDIIISGCGPTGALLSTYLCRLGIRRVVLEREQQITTDPRGIVLDEDGMRIMRGVGLYQPLFDEVGSVCVHHHPLKINVEEGYAHVHFDSPGLIPFHRGRSRFTCATFHTI